MSPITKQVTKDKTKKKVYDTIVDFTEVVKFILKGTDAKRNPVYGLSINGTELNEQEVHSLQAENVAFENSRLHKIITNTLRQAAIDKVLHNSGKEIHTDAEYKAEEDVGRAMIVALDVIENIIYTLKIQK